MVHKKFIRRGGKLYGPYYYESYREGDKVRKRYLTESEFNSQNKGNLIFDFSRVTNIKSIGIGLLIFLAAAIFLIYNAQPVENITIEKGMTKSEGLTKWTENISLEVPGKIAITLPIDAENISAKKMIDGRAEEVKVEMKVVTGKVTARIELERESRIISWLRKLFSRITGKIIGIDEESGEVLEIKLTGDAREYVIEYYSSAMPEKEANFEWFMANPSATIIVLMIINTALLLITRGHLTRRKNELS
jgi:hypothetical protein